MRERLYQRLIVVLALLIILEIVFLSKPNIFAKLTQGVTKRAEAVLSDVVYRAQALFGSVAKDIALYKESKKASSHLKPRFPIAQNKLKPVSAAPTSTPKPIVGEVLGVKKEATSVAELSEAPSSASKGATEDKQEKLQIIQEVTNEVQAPSLLDKEAQIKVLLEKLDAKIHDISDIKKQIEEITGLAAKTITSREDIEKLTERTKSLLTKNQEIFKKLVKTPQETLAETVKVKEAGAVLGEKTNAIGEPPQKVIPSRVDSPQSVISSRAPRSPKSEEQAASRDLVASTKDASKISPALEKTDKPQLYLGAAVVVLVVFLIIIRLYYRRYVQKTP